MKDVGGAGFAGSSPPFRGRAAVDVDVGPERRSPRYHETCHALESVKERPKKRVVSRCAWRNSRRSSRNESAQKCWHDDDDVYYYIRWRLELEGETENTGVCTKERKGVTAAVLMATPCTNSLGGESGGQKHEGCGGRSACWKYAAVSGAGAGGRRC